MGIQGKGRGGTCIPGANRQCAAPNPARRNTGPPPHFRGYPTFPPLKWKPRGIRCQPCRGMIHQAPIGYGDSHQRDLMERFSLPPGCLPSPHHDYPPRHCDPDQQDTRGLPALEHTSNLLRDSTSTTDHNRHLQALYQNLPHEAEDSLCRSWRACLPVPDFSGSPTQSVACLSTRCRESLCRRSRFWVVI